MVVHLLRVVEKEAIANTAEVVLKVAGKARRVIGRGSWAGVCQGRRVTDFSFEGRGEGGRGRQGQNISVGWGPEEGRVLRDTGGDAGSVGMLDPGPWVGGWEDAVPHRRAMSIVVSEIKGVLVERVKSCGNIRVLDRNGVVLGRRGTAGGRRMVGSHDAPEGWVGLRHVVRKGVARAHCAWLCGRRESVLGARKTGERREGLEERVRWREHNGRKGKGLLLVLDREEMFGYVMPM